MVFLTIRVKTESRNVLQDIRSGTPVKTPRSLPFASLSSTFVPCSSRMGATRGWKASLPRGQFDRDGIGSTLRPDRRSHSPYAGSFIRRQLELASSSANPPITFKSCASQVIWFNLLVVLITPLISVYGVFAAKFNVRTVCFCVAYYVFNMLGTSARFLMSPCQRTLLTFAYSRYYGWCVLRRISVASYNLMRSNPRLSSSVVAPSIQCLQAASIRSRYSRCRRGPRFN